MKKFYITTPIYYSSGNPHIGHAFTTILADTIARYKRLIGYDVCFLTGLDEHGEKIAAKASENNMTPQAWVDYEATIFQSLWKELKISNDLFIRTTDPKHVKVVQEVFEYFIKNNDIYLGTWESLYCVNCEEAYNAGEAIKKEDGQLYCRVGHKLTTKSEPSYFFKMSQFTDWIKEYYANNPNAIYPSTRVNEIMNSFVNEGIQDLSVSRISVKWGIEVPSNPNHVIYVWIDALLNYLTALDYKQPNDELFQKYWNDENCEVVHLMSKEITRFHCIYWPIMLKCLNLRLPSKVVSHGWIITKEGKMSKSLGNVINPLDYIKQFGIDSLRYYLMKEIPLENDGVFSHELFIELYNSDLANIYGNLVSRFLGMINLYNEGKITTSNTGDSESVTAFINDINFLLNNIEEKINSFKMNEVLKLILEFGKSTNKFIQENKPWELNKEGKKDELNNLLFYVANAIRVLTSLLSPVLVDGTQKIKEQMNFSDEQLQFSNLKNFNLLNDHKVSSISEPIYQRYANK